tara:strand:+ start:39 stop:653 length:615 start_codon:yes stop_codon:yes gene_type:complete
MGVLSAGVAGFALSMGLILAIGPQNIFVLRQGLLRSHVFAVCLVCSLADALLIAVGVLGLGAYLSGVEGAEFWISMAAALFIAGYGAMRVRSSMDPSGMSIGEDDGADLLPTLGTAMAFTFLNPHVYLDTVILIGSASSRYATDERASFAIGAMLASFLFFFALGYGARRLSSLLESPESWRVIDRGIACVMFVIAGAIAYSVL